MLSSKIVTSRDIKNKFRITLKGGIPEPTYDAQTFGILGDSSVNFADLKEGYNKNVRKYFFDTSTFEFSPETQRIEEDVAKSQVSPAFGPTITPALDPCDKKDFYSIITRSTLRSLNEYWRQLTIQQIQLLQNADLFKKGTGTTSGKTATQHVLELGAAGKQGPADVILYIEEQRSAEQLIPPDSDELTLIWAKEVNPPNASYGEGHPKLMEISLKLENLVQKLWDESLIDDAGEFQETYPMLEAAKRNLMENFELTDATQDVFGHGDLTCWERSETQPYIPFTIKSKKKLQKGVPHVFRVMLNQPPRGMERSRIHFDLSEAIRMTIEQGANIKISRRRTLAEVKAFLNEQRTHLNKAEITRLEKEFMKFTGEDAINKAEERLEAMYLAALVYNPDETSGEDSYGEVLAKLGAQNNQIEDYKKEMVTIRKSYRELSKKNAGRKLTKLQKAQRESDLDAVRVKQRTLKQTAGKNEALRRKIADYKKIIYSQEESWFLSNTVLVDNPVEFIVTDYGVGIVQFEANSGKELFIFHDSESARRSLKAPKKITNNQAIRMLDNGPNGSYMWLIGGAPIKISGNGGSFIFALDSVNIGNAQIDIPVITNKQIMLSDSKDSADGKTITIQQMLQSVLVTNLPAYGKSSVHTLSNPAQITTPGGTIQVELIPGAEIKEFRPSDIPGHTTWVQFLAGTKKTPYSVNNVQTNYYAFRIRVKFIVNDKELPGNDKDENEDLPGALVPSLPLLFRGFINIDAEARDWDEVVGNPHVLNSGDNLNGQPYTINVEPTFNDAKRRPVYQVTLTYKHGLPPEVLQRVYDYMPGKRCDIDYIYDNQVYPIVTDGYITEAISEDMLTVTPPPDPNSPIISGFYHYGATKTIFNVADSMRFMEDKLMSEGVILEGYHFQTAINKVLVNSGFPRDKIMFGNTGEDGIELNGAYVNATNPNEKYLPVALPGQKHSFVTDPTKDRFTQVDSIMERYGWVAEGTLFTWVDQRGNIRIDGPIKVATDPRWGNYMFYQSRAQAQQLSAGVDPQQLAKYIYYGTITRRRSLEDFYSILKVSGATHPITGKQSTVGFVKKEAVSDKYMNENIYLGHHKEMPTVDMPDAKTNEELLGMLYHLKNLHTSMREIWNVTVPYNPFLLPLDVVFISPDARAGDPHRIGSWLSRPPLSGTGGAVGAMINEPNPDIGWKVLNVSGNELDDEMVLTVIPLNREEKRIVKNILGS